MYSTIMMHYLRKQDIHNRKNFPSSSSLFLLKFLFTILIVSIKRKVINDNTLKFYNRHGRDCSYLRAITFFNIIQSCPILYMARVQVYGTTFAHLSRQQSWRQRYNERLQNCFNIYNPKTNLLFYLIDKMLSLKQQILN